MAGDIVRKVSVGLSFNLIRVGVSLVIGLLYSIIAVRWLRVDNFGVYIFLDSIFSTLAFIYVLGTHSLQTRFVPELEAKKDFPRLRRLLGISERINFLSASATFLVIFIGADIVARLISNPELTALVGYPELSFYIRLIALGIVPGAVLGITKSILDALYEQRFLSLAGIAFSIMDFTLLIALVVFLGLGLVGVIILPVLSLSVGALVYYSWLKRKHKVMFQGVSAPLGPELKDRMMRYAAPLIFLGLYNHFVAAASQNLFLGIFKTMRDVTYFDVPYSFIAAIFDKMTLVIGGLGVISLVEIRTLDSTKIRTASAQFVKLISLYVIPIVFGGLVLAEPLLTLLYGNELLPSVLPFRITLVLLGLTFPLGFNNAILYAFEKTSYVLKWNMLFTLQLIVLNLLLIPTFGVIGAIVAISIVSILSAAVFTHQTMVKLKIGNFIPAPAIARYLVSSLPMAAFLFAVSIVFKIESIVLLMSLIVLGFLIYVIGLRLTKAFDEQDREFISRSKIPLKKLVLKLI